MKKISPYSLDGNVFKMLDKDWMLITAGKSDHFNTMTASWGAMGILWHKPVAIIFVRPTRYTYQFLEGTDHFTLCFFRKKYRKILNICGSKSGRDTDKIRETGLLPSTTPEGNVYFEQAEVIIECKKWYSEDLNPSRFLDPDIEKNYPQRDYHRVYYGLIENCWLNQDKV
jgi:flavin reductase (DIM6/NTAB) family NADH-FMN oxidoreductase RutF